MLFLCIIIILRGTIGGAWCKSADGHFSGDPLLTTTQLIAKHGYVQHQTHHVTTVDGYILELHRIHTAGGQPVILMHGVLDSSATWVLSGPKTGLAYILSDLGYDVWMGNARGNIYSKYHKRHRANGTRQERKLFWNFSWHEMGLYDLPAIIDYVLAQTNFSKLHYIGHSQGVTAFFVMTSERPEYNEKILLMTALAPAVFMANVGDQLGRVFAKYWTTIEILNEALGLYSYSTEMDELLSLTTKTLCSMGSRVATLCDNNSLPLIGHFSHHINASIVPIIKSHTPAGASNKQFFHYGQLIENHRFSKFDYGKVRNMHKYGGTTAPNYSLGNCTVPVALFYSAQDRLAAADNVQRLAHELPNVLAVRRIRDDTFNHIDFVWAMDAKDLLYTYVLNLMHIAEWTNR